MVVCVLLDTRLKIGHFSMCFQRKYMMKMFGDAHCLEHYYILGRGLAGQNENGNPQGSLMVVAVPAAGDRRPMELSRSGD